MNHRDDRPATSFEIHAQEQSNHHPAIEAAHDTAIPPPVAVAAAFIPLALITAINHEPPRTAVIVDNSRLYRQYKVDVRSHCPTALPHANAMLPPQSVLRRMRLLP
jgi:hypothetical protein